MGTITVRVSDLTGEQITDEGQALRLIVEHPDFSEPIGLDVLPNEIQRHLTDERTRFVVLSLEEPDDPNPLRYVMLLDEFEDLFQAGDSFSVLENALAHQHVERERTNRRGTGRRGDRRQQPQEPRQRIDYASAEHAGEPHPGTISEAERLYVQEHLDEVNERLRQKGMREIDPTDLTMIERYGLTPPDL